MEEEKSRGAAAEYLQEQTCEERKKWGCCCRQAEGRVELVSLGKRGTTFYCPYCAAVRLAALGSRDGALLAVRSEQLGQKRLLPHFSPFSSFCFRIF
jgi:hypothetical protein